MLKAAQLRDFAHQAAQSLGRERKLAEYELYCSSAEQVVARLSFTSDFPCRGVEELKSLASDGFALRLVPRGSPLRIGESFEAGEFSLGRLRAAVGRALDAAIADPDFAGLPSDRKAALIKRPQRSDLIGLGNRGIVSAAWAMLGGALRAFQRGTPQSLPAAGLVLGGDLTITRDRIAVASSHWPEARYDESAHYSASLTALIEKLAAKGSAITIGRSREQMARSVPRLGAQALSAALKTRRGERHPGGKYRALLGPQPIAEILNYIVLPSLTTGAFRAASSAYLGKFGGQVMDRAISIVDDPASPRAAIARAITCEGLAASPTQLIRRGELVGLMSNFYDGHRLATDPHRAERLGKAAGAAAEFPANNGYRLGESAARSFESQVGTTGSSVFMRVEEGQGEAALLKALGDGIYVGRVWYTYPINGQRAGDLSCTVTGDSYIVRNGARAAALAPNCLRINAHIDQIFGELVAAGSRLNPAFVWGSPEAFYVPAIVVDSLEFAPVDIVDR